MRYNYLLLSIIALIVFSSLVSADLGSFKTNRCVDIKTVLNSSSVNISTINYPDGTTAISNKVMTQLTPKNFNYTFCNTGTLGKYTYGYFDNEGNVYSNSFTITSTGFTGTLGFYFIFLAIILGVFILGYSMQNNYIMMLASILVLFLGFFVISFGIDILKDTQTTWAVGIIIWAVGIICIYTSLEEQLKVYG